MYFHCTCSKTLKCKLSCSLAISRASRLSQLLIWFLLQCYWYKTSLCYFHLRNIYRLCPFPALVTSHLDYCNVILSGFPTNSVMRSKWDTTDHITLFPSSFTGSQFLRFFNKRFCFLLSKSLMIWHLPISQTTFSLTPLDMLYAQHHPECSWLQTKHHGDTFISLMILQSSSLNSESISFVQHVSYTHPALRLDYFWISNLFY